MENVARAAVIVIALALSALLLVRAPRTEAPEASAEAKAKLQWIREDIARMREEARDLNYQSDEPLQFQPPLPVSEPSTPAFIPPPRTVDAAPIRRRLEALLGEIALPDHVSDEMDVEFSEWCVQAIASSSGVTFDEAMATAHRALLVSATEEGLIVLTALENAAVPTEREKQARSQCARELYYALPGDEPANQ